MAVRSIGFCNHFDGMTGHCSQQTAHPVQAFIVDLLPVALTQFDDGSFGTGAKTTIAFKAVCRNSVTLGLITCFGWRQTMCDFIKIAAAAREAIILFAEPPFLYHVQFTGNRQSGVCRVWYRGDFVR